MHATTINAHLRSILYHLFTNRQVLAQRHTVYFIFNASFSIFLNVSYLCGLLRKAYILLQTVLAKYNIKSIKKKKKITTFYTWHTFYTILFDPLTPNCSAAYIVQAHWRTTTKAFSNTGLIRTKKQKAILFLYIIYKFHGNHYIKLPVSELFIALNVLQITGNYGPVIPICDLTDI